MNERTPDLNRIGRASIAEKLKDILNSFNPGRDLFKEKEKREKIDNFDNELRRKGLKPLDYELWHVLNGMNLPEGKTLDFDTKNNDIENFIMKTFDENNKI
ncbi:MAG: hypothetical protein WCX27_00670 [Candidatus Paceibacterota bacterium]|jgi:hypothetical protein